jgi:flagellar export protein FliJ
MSPTTRLDKVVELRERAEDDALCSLARAQATLGIATERLSLARHATRADARAAGPVELWHIDELSRRRALQVLRAAEGDVSKAKRGEAEARLGFTSAHRDTEIVRRVQTRRVTEILDERARRERRDVDEICTLRFNAGQR